MMGWLNKEVKFITRLEKRRRWFIQWSECKAGNSVKWCDADEITYVNASTNCIFLRAVAAAAARRL
jgi:hypothetical protein